MSRRLLQVVVVVFVLFLTGSVFASEIKELTIAPHSRSREGLGGIDRVLCVDGLKVFQTATYGQGTAVSNLQLYEEKNGNVVPVRCDESSAKK